MIREINVISPPGVHISWGEPVQLCCKSLMVSGGTTERRLEGEWEWEMIKVTEGKSEWERDISGSEWGKRYEGDGCGEGYGEGFQGLFAGVLI